ncbi:TonB-dependent receptor [Weeksellaceae bacterium A-14]
MKRPILYVWAFSALFSGKILAQEKETSINEVQIQGKFFNTPYSRVNENVEIITAEDIRNSPAQSIDELLQQYSGMDIRRRGANGVQSDVSVRGGSYEQVLILLNGIRMNDSQTGHNSMNIPVDLSAVERVEIIKGPAARRFGQNAYTGVINIITKTSSQEKAKISAEGGDFKTWSLGINTTFGTDKLQNLFQANTSESAGYRHNTDYKIHSVFYQNRYLLKNGNIGLMAGYSEKDFGANGFYASPSATEQYEEMQASVVSVSYTQQFNKLRLNSSLFWRRGQDMYLYLRNNPSYYRNMHIGNNAGGEVNASYNSTLGTTGLGIELRKEYLVSSNLGDRDRFATQVFFEHHIAFFGDKFQVSPGFSWASYSGSGNFFYPGLDLGFNFSPEHKIYGNIAKVHRIPTFTDLYYTSKTESGNPDLKPESAVSTEVGYRFSPENFSFKASLFSRESTDAIDWIKNAENEIWKAENIGNIKTKGFEVETEARLTNIGTALRVGYTYLDNKIKRSAVLSKYVAENLRHQFTATLTSHFLKHFSNELNYRYLQRVSTGSYHLLDEKLSFRKGDMEVYALLNNLTNAKYTEAFGVPMPGRWFHIGISYTVK